MMITASDFSGGIKAIPSDTINIPGPESKYSGISTAVASSKLIDTSIGGADSKFGFNQAVNSSGKVINQGVQVGDVVYNSSTARPGVAYVTAIDSPKILSLSADIFPATANRDGYSIYRGNGVNLGVEDAWSLVAQDVLASSSAVTTDNTAGYGAASEHIITKSGGTYAGAAAFNVGIAVNGKVNFIRITLDQPFSNVNLAGQTIEFDQASIRAATGVNGTGEFIITITSSMLEFRTTKNQNPKPFQLYCGGTAANPPLACDIYVTSINGDFVFFEGVQPGEILPIAISKINIGSAAAAGNGNNNTLTTATGRYVALN